MRDGWLIQTDQGKQAFFMDATTHSDWKLHEDE